MNDLFSLDDHEINALPSSVRDVIGFDSGPRGFQQKIITLLRIAERPLNTKELIIGLYKKYGYEVTKRNPFSAQLSRMVTSGKIESVPGRRGLYKLIDQKTT